VAVTITFVVPIGYVAPDTIGDDCRIRIEVVDGGERKATVAPAADVASAETSLAV
jgi:hypothetical protein